MQLFMLMLWINIGFTFSPQNIPSRNVKPESSKCTDGSGSTAGCENDDQRIPTYSQYKGPHPNYSDSTQIKGKNQEQYQSQQGFSIDTSHMIDTDSYGTDISPHQKINSSKVYFQAYFQYAVVFHHQFMNISITKLGNLLNEYFCINLKTIKVSYFINIYCLLNTITLCFRLNNISLSGDQNSK